MPLKRLYRWTEKSAFVDFVIIILSLVSIILLVYELSADLSSEQITLIHTIDFIIALIFLSDFLLGILFAKNRVKYLQQNWTDLLASIPFTEGIYRSLRILRLIRLVRIVRIIAGYKRVDDVADKTAKDSSKYIYIVSITVTVILSGAVALFTLEFDSNENLKNFSDALWWSVSTVTNNGSEIYPISWEGRILASGLMFFGIGLMGTIAGLMGSHFLKKMNES